MQKTNDLCQAEDIRLLNQTKEYTLIATQLLNKLFTDERLNDHHIKCWQYLFNKARFSPALEVTISYNEIASFLNKSRRTIMRYVRALTVCSYLDIVSNSSINDGYRPNTLRVRAPKTFIERMLENKDRTQNKASNSTAKVPKKSIAVLQDNSTETFSAAPSVEIAQVCIASVPEECAPVVNTDVEVAAEKAAQSQLLVTHLSLAPGDTNVTLNNKDLKEIHNNNKTDEPPVVVDNNFSASTSQTAWLAQLEEQRDIIQQRKAAMHIQHQRKVTAGSFLSLEELNAYGRLESALRQVEQAINQANSPKNLQSSTLAVLEEDLTHVYKRQGDNPVTPSAFQRLVSALQTMGHAGRALNKLVNQILFEVRFGSLVKNKLGIPMRPDHGINIALKLVRENRWAEPVLLAKQRMA